MGPSGWPHRDMEPAGLGNPGCLQSLYQGLPCPCLPAGTHRGSSPVLCWCFITKQVFPLALLLYTSIYCTMWQLRESVLTTRASNVALFSCRDAKNLSHTMAMNFFTALNDFPPTAFYLYGRNIDF